MNLVHDPERDTFRTDRGGLAISRARVLHGGEEDDGGLGSPGGGGFGPPPGLLFVTRQITTYQVFAFGRLSSRRLDYSSESYLRHQPAGGLLQQT